jgi:CheY-like chemotaxis protein
MTQPLALVLYQKLLPGSQLVNRLQDLGYRVQTLAEPGRLLEQAESGKPMLVVVDVSGEVERVCQEISRLKRHPATSHLPVIALTGSPENVAAREGALAAAATLAVSDTAILAHLDQFLDQALRVD